MEIESARYAITYRPVDIVGEAESPLTQGRLVAVATGPPARSTPSNVWLLDVSNDASTQWIGAVSLTSSATDGFINRTFMRNGFLYAATYGKGIQAIDLGTVIDGFKAPGTDAFFQMSQALFTDGRGFGQENVLSIPVDGPHGPARLEDLEAGPVGPEGRLARRRHRRHRPHHRRPRDAPGPLERPGHRRSRRRDTHRRPRHRPGKIDGYDIAVVAGSGTVLGEPQTLLMVVDISNPSGSSRPGLDRLEDASVGDILVKDDLALLGGGQQVTVVSLTDPTQPRVTGTIAGVGGRLALTETGLLYSTARSVFGGETELGGVRTAALGSIAILESASPLLIQVGDDGRTLEPIELTFRVIAPPDTPVELSAALGEGGESPMAKVRLAGVTGGTQTVSLPAGILLDPPAPRLEFRAIREDGSRTAPVYHEIVSHEVARAREEEFQLRPAFFAVTPGFAHGGDEVKRITVTGKNLAGMRTLYIQDEEATWHSIPVAGVPTEASFAADIPGFMLSAPGFLQLSPFEGEVQEALAFVVGDPATPSAGTLEGVGLTGVSSTEIGPGGTLTLSGTGFSEGMTAIVGRNPGVTLTTTFVDATTIQVELPPGYVGTATDLYVSIVSPDGTTRSASLPVQATQAEAPVNWDALYEPGQMVLLNTTGTIEWNGGPNQKITLHGVDLEPGTRVEIIAGRKKETVVAIAGPPNPNPQPRVGAVSVQIPSVFAQRLRYYVYLLSGNSRLLPTAGAKPAAAFPTVEIPLGGRLKFSAYKVEGDKRRVHIVPLADPAVGRVKCAGQIFDDRLAAQDWATATKRQKLPIDRVTYALTQLTRPSGADPARALPLVEKETNRCDPGTRDSAGTISADLASRVLYLRGIRLPQESERGTIVATFEDPASPEKPLWGRLHFKVVRPTVMGPTTMDAELIEGLVDAASWGGVPPHFLKAQAAQETSKPVKDDPRNYRYEPMTIDYQQISSGTADASNHRTKPVPYFYFTKHLKAGRAVKVDPQPSETDGDWTVCTEGTTPASGSCDGEPVPVGASSFTIVRPPAQEAIRYSTVKAQRHPSNTAVSRIDPPIEYYDLQAKKWVRVRYHDPVAGQFKFDPTDNTAQLGKPLEEGEWVEFAFERVVTEPVTAGECGTLLASELRQDGNPNRSYQHPDNVSFADDDTIASYFARNQQTNPGGGWRGNDSEKKVEWVTDPSKAGGARFKGVLNPEFHVVPTQLAVAGSFGPFHATVLDWDSANRRPYLERSGFKLQDTGVCLQDLRPRGATVAEMKEPVAKAAKVAVASHGYNMTTTKAAYTCTAAPGAPGVCDQIDFARRWSKILSRYNPGAPGAYVLGSPPPHLKKLQDSKLNWIGQEAVVEYDVDQAVK